MPTQFINNLRSVLDQAREIGGRLGLRQWQISLVKEVWSGSPGSDNADGTSATMLSRTVTPIKVGQNDADPPVRKVTQEGGPQSGGTLQNKVLVVKFAKPYTSTNVTRTFDVADFDPVAPTDGTSIQLYFLVTGPENANPQIYIKTAQNVDKNLGFEITLTSTGRQMA